MQTGMGSHADGPDVIGSDRIGSYPIHRPARTAGATQVAAAAHGWLPWSSRCSLARLQQPLLLAHQLLVGAACPLPAAAFRAVAPRRCVVPRHGRQGSNHKPA